VLLGAADDPEGWRGAALKLKGLAASFGAVRLMALAQEAADAQAGDRAVLRKLERAVERL
jgi:HPt (histidine-containing phosphotransfer) domain-containing protein